MDWNAIQQYLPLYQKAAVLTVRLGVAGIIFAIIIGLACAVIQYDKVPVLRQIEALEQLLVSIGAMRARAASSIY